MVMIGFPVIDPVATGENILRLRKARGLSVRDLQNWFGFEEPQAIYKWQKGKSLPTVDNLYALGALLHVPMEEILVPTKNGQQEHSCCPPLFHGIGKALSACGLLFEGLRSAQGLQAVAIRIPLCSKI